LGATKPKSRKAFLLFLSSLWFSNDLPRLLFFWRFKNFWIFISDISFRLVNIFNQTKMFSIHVYPSLLLSRVHLCVFEEFYTIMINFNPLCTSSLWFSNDLPRLLFICRFKNFWIFISDISFRLVNIFNQIKMFSIHVYQSLLLSPVHLYVFEQFYTIMINFIPLCTSSLWFSNDLPRLLFFWRFKNFWIFISNISFRIVNIFNQTKMFSIHVYRSLLLSPVHL
jgi:hypothetical protein